MHIMHVYIWSIRYPITSYGINSIALYSTHIMLLWGCIVAFSLLLQRMSSTSIHLRLMILSARGGEGGGRGDLSFKYSPNKLSF